MSNSELIQEIETIKAALTSAQRDLEDNNYQGAGDNAAGAGHLLTSVTRKITDLFHTANTNTPRTLNPTSGAIAFRINIIEYNPLTKEKKIIEKVGEYTSEKFAKEMFNVVVYEPQIHHKELVMVTAFTGKEEIIVLNTTLNTKDI